MDAINLITSCQLLPLVTLTSKDQVEPLCKVLINAGLPLIEITLRDEKTLDILANKKIGSLGWIEYRELKDGFGAFKEIHNGTCVAPKIILLVN